MTQATLQDLLGSLAARGDVPAVIAFTGERAETVTFGALHRDAFALARALAARGIGPGETVAVIGPNGPPWITAFWAIVAAGAAVVALDVQLGDEEARRMLDLARCRLVFAPSTRGDLGRDGIALDAPFPRGDGADPPQRAQPEEMALLLFTSGTTGTPKGVPLTHANLLSNVNELSHAGVAGAGDRALLPLPLHHAYPLTVGMLTAFACGAALVLPAGMSGPELMGALREGHASVLMGVPRLYGALVAGIRQRVAAQPRIKQRLFALMLALSRRGTARLLFRGVRRTLAPELRLLVSGGAKLEDADEAFLTSLGWNVLTGYGLTETSPILAFNRPGAAKPGSAGQPLHGIGIRIANQDETGLGEIEAKGASVFRGYLSDDEATRRAFTVDGWFRSGDFGRIDAEGYLYIIARVSETIVLADGKKLFPEAVEAVYGAHPFVKEVALLARDGALVALVVPDLEAMREEGAARIRDAIRDALGGQSRSLPSHARLSGFAIAREKLPRTQLGKIRRHLLPALYEAALSGSEPSAVVELSDADKALLAEPAAAAVWNWLKARFPGRALGLDMNPQLDLGIDSLGWVDLTLTLERAYGLTLTEREIGRIVTLRDLLREAVTAGKRPAAVAAPEKTTLPRLGHWAIVQRVGGALVRLVMEKRFKLSVEGDDTLPSGAPFLICPNHESYLDPFALAAALSPSRLPRTWWGGWTGILFNTRLRRLFSRVAQVVPVDQYRGGGASLALAEQVFKRGHALVWFPEGALSRDGKLQRFQPGVGVLVLRHNVRVVPALIEGSFECWPADSGFLGYHPIRVRFGPAIEPAPLIAATGGDPQRIADAIHDAVASLAKDATP